MAQLHMRGTFQPVDADKLTSKERRAAPESHLFLKKKRDGTIKGRAVAGGNKQRGTIQKEAAASPTAALESVF